MNIIGKITGREANYKNKKILIENGNLIIAEEKIDISPKLIPQRISMDKGIPVIIFKQK